nr:hypothetical protein [Chloroflexota bacterium]
MNSPYRVCSWHWFGLSVITAFVLLVRGSLVVASLSASSPAFKVHLPLIFHSEPCQPLNGERYTTLSAYPPGPHLPAEVHPDFNLAIQGYVPTDAHKGLVEYDGQADPAAPQFAGLFAEPRLPLFRLTCQVYLWDWVQMRRGLPITNPPVTLLFLETTPGETLHVPDSGYTIGSGCEVLVLYASEERITLKYTREDNVVYGYTLHVEGVCVDPALLALYRACNEAGRSQLPALRPRQAFGRARNNQVGIAIRDCGTFLDPRSRKDWWRDY